MSAKDFFAHWVHFINEEIKSKPNWINKYNNDDNWWTKQILGTKQSKSEKSPFGDYIANRISLRYRTEDGLTDLSFATDFSLENVYSLHENKDDRNPAISKKNYFPQFYEILLEHENDIYSCYQEMAKLAYSRSRLKVLITYNENVDATSNYKYVTDVLLENFCEIITQSNQKYPENNETEYLLIVGQLDNKNLAWNAYIIDSTGKEIETA